MKRTVYIFLAIAVLFASATASAQTVGGIMIGSADFQSTGILEGSQSDESFTTARVAAMGGAFTSLGGDMASININPAGLGMFRSSMLSFSPSVTNSNTTNVFNDAGSNKSRFSVNNIGLALNLYQGSHSPVSFTFGFSYNKLADYNYNSRYSLGSSKWSIADVFANQIWGINSSAIVSSADPFRNYDIYVNEWGGVLAFQSALIDPATGSSDTYVVNAISSDADIYSSLDVASKGSMGEYSIAGGVNVDNHLYLGFTLGIRDIFSEQDYNYFEEYDSHTTSSNYLDGMFYNTHVKQSGSGVNLKLGMIYRPFDGLRFGVAFHSPTWISLERQYYGVMGTRFIEENNFSTNSTLTDVYTYNYATAPKLSLGVSYTFGNIAALSFDYDRVWYNGMRLQEDDGSYNQDMKSIIKEQYQGANNFRIGAEVKPLPMLAFRVGYGYYGSSFKYDDLVFDSPVATTKQNITSGVGFKFGRVSLDLAYIYSETKYSEYDTFYYAGPDNNGNQVTIGSNPVEDVKRTRNTFTATMNIPF